MDAHADALAEVAIAFQSWAGHLLATHVLPVHSVPCVDHGHLCLHRDLCRRFADGECRVTIQETIMGKDVFVVSPSHTNDSLMELLLVIATARRQGDETPPPYGREAAMHSTALSRHEGLGSPYIPLGSSSGI